jgi:hypothetical protein
LDFFSKRRKRSDEERNKCAHPPCFEKCRGKEEKRWGDEAHNSIRIAVLSLSLSPSLPLTINVLSYSTTFL